MLKTLHASLLLLALGLVAVITSCEKKQEVPSVPEAPKVEVKVPVVKARNAEHKTLRSLTVSGKKVALTFDDGPDDNVVPILDMLAKAGGKATFFLVGRNVAKQPEVAKKVIDAGCEIGNHSYSHCWFNAPTYTADDKVREELVKTQQIIKEKTGVTPVLFRSPYFKYTHTLFGVIDELQLTAVDACINPADYDKNTTSAQVFERVTTKVSPGSIVLLHSYAPCTLQALPDIIKFLKDNGYEIVTVSELIKISKMEAVAP